MVKDLLIVGMLLGKMEWVCELGLELIVEEGLCLEFLFNRINVEDIVILLGNFIDNVFDVIFIVIWIE